MSVIYIIVTKKCSACWFHVNYPNCDAMYIVRLTILIDNLIKLNRRLYYGDKGLDWFQNE